MGSKDRLDQGEKQRRAAEAFIESDDDSLKQSKQEWRRFQTDV